MSFLVDFLILLAVGFGLYRGYKIGFVRQLGSTVGFLGGLLASSWLNSIILPQMHGASAKTAMSFSILLGTITVCMLLGEMLANRLKTSTEKPWVHNIDNSLGGIMSSITVLGITWMLCSLTLLAPPSRIQTLIQKSSLYGAIAEQLPPATIILSNLNKLVEVNTTPQVFQGDEPSPQAQLKAPDEAAFADAIRYAKKATVKIEGFGCGGITTGSGFLYAKHLVVTNAHVVAGIAYPKVVDSRGGTHNAVVVSFSPENDLAVLRLEDIISATPLVFTPGKLAPGTGVAVLGYPGGGKFNAKTAVVLERITAVGLDIYQQSQTIRKVYSLQAHIVHGNSGGPIIDNEGRVAGVVFATSTAYNNIGYALTNEQVADQLAAAKQGKPITTGQTCSQE